jgi:translocation and assembly module TamA
MPLRLPPALALVPLLLPAAVALGSVEVRGVTGALRDNVLARLSLDEASCDVPPWRLRRLLRRADAEIRSALEAYGHYEPQITISAPADVDGCWRSTIGIDPGEPVRLREVTVTVSGPAAADPAWGRLRDRTPLTRGAVLNHATYERYKAEFLQLARRQGYFAAAFAAAAVDVHVTERAADVTLRFESGPRYRFGPVSFSQDVVRPGLVQRFVSFRAGEPYDGAVVEELYNALLATGYFGSVDLRREPRGAPDLDVPISIALTPARRQTYVAGLGYSTDTGIKLRGGYTNRRLNSRGHQFDASFSVSQVLSEAGISYRLPRADPRIEWFSVDAGYQHEDTDTSTSDIWKTGLKEFRRRRGNWIETRFVDASIERFEIAGERQREFLLVPGVSWSRTVPANPTVARLDAGHRLTLRLSGTGEFLGSDAEFLQADVAGKAILPLWPGARLLTRAEIGATLKDRFRDLPASVRYFAGGDASIRGYDYESLGPTDESGEVIGGSHRLIFSLELDQRVWRNWSAAAFVDTGNAVDSFASLSMKTGVGGGIRWYSPLGPVRLDLAFPLDKDAPDDWRIHVTLGPDL